MSPPLTAAHGAEIVALGVTSDAAHRVAAASADRLGGLRLWPTLDGTHEPIVIQGTASRAVVLARDGDGFALSTLDDAGSVHTLRISAAGAVWQRSMVASAQAALEIADTPEGLLILRADQSLELVDAAGQLRARLTPDPGLHIDTILVRGSRALALVHDGKRVRGQWIVLEQGMRWGASTPTFRVKIAHAVLSPDGDLLAVRRPRSLHPVLLDLATGAPRKTPLCVTKDWPGDEGSVRELLDSDNTPTPLGFVTGTLVACSVSGVLQWWTTGGDPPPFTAGTLELGASPGAVAGVAVFGINASLAIATPGSNRYLGYGLHGAGQLHRGPNGVLIASGDQAFVLDDALRERSRFETGRTMFDWSYATLIDDRYAIMMSLRPDPHDKGYRVAVFDGVARAYHQILPDGVRDKAMEFEPSTGLFHVITDAGAMLLPLDPRTHTLGKASKIASWLPPSRIALLDPEQAGGVAALEVNPAGDGVIVGELELADLQPGAQVLPRRSYRVPGQVRATDRAGRVYAQSSESEEVVVYERGNAVARLPGLAGMSLLPNRDGSLIAAFESPRLVLLTARGQVRWEAAHWKAHDIAWTASGDLLARFPSGLAHVDLETGALALRRCGWAFGLSDMALRVGHSGPSICDVAR